MSEAAGQCLDGISLYERSSGSGASEEARQLDIYRDRIIYLDNSITFGQSKREAVNSLNEISKECSKANWDRYGANAVSNDSVNEARHFVELMPSFFPRPQILPEPSGEIGFEWYKDKRLIFVVSFSGKGSISYAGIFGSNKVHGTEYFSDCIPEVIYENIRRLSR